MAILNLQLFPLQAVLYPHGVMPLHIFEQRYRTMIRMCIDHQVPFGIVQISSGLEVGGRARTYPIGTVAEIKSVTEFQDGRLFINVKGASRFRILESAYDGECLTARVEEFGDDPNEKLNTAEVRELTESVTKHFEKYWQLLEMVMKKELGKAELPKDPVVLSWIIPTVLHVQPELKQTILQRLSVAERLELEKELLIEEIEKLLEMWREAHGN